jgi:hypothetical protein
MNIFKGKLRYFRSKVQFLRINFVWIVRYRPNHRFQFKTVWPPYEQWQMAALRAQLGVVKIYRCIGGNQLLKNHSNKRKVKSVVCLEVY